MTPFRSPLTGRLLALSALLIAGVVVIHASVPETPQTRRAPLAQLPASMGGWQSTGDIAIDEESLKVLKADDYVSRFYVRGAASVELLIAYYATQRQGDTMHSPMNCLPASGWEPMSTERIHIATAGGTLNANRAVIQKGLDKEVVLYWYQSHGRTIASEYASKAYLVLDALRQHRSDAALVRVAAPLVGAEADVNRATTDFIQSLYPTLSPHIPD